MYSGITLITEGKARLWVPDVERRKGPGKRMPGFYNPVMRVAREMDIYILDALHQKPKLYLDALAGVGARGIRIMTEVKEMEERVILNDLSPKGFALINLNLRENDLSAGAYNMDFMSAVNIAPFEWIDIDPYGSPVPFLHPALSSMKRGYISVTATDTSVLSGAYPSVCLRRYGINSVRTYAPHEVGLRGLISYIIRVASSLDRGVNVLVSYSSEHYYRCILRVDYGARLAERSLSTLGEMVIGGHVIHPLYLGPLASPELLRATPHHLSSECMRIITLLRDECALPPGYLHTDRLAREAGVPPPGVSRLIELLHAHGYKAARTHIDPKGIRTDTNEKEVIRLLKTECQ
jgi:tRNA (guanine26-N2/guanine27-N2)-dimethyltransferase